MPPSRCGTERERLAADPFARTRDRTGGRERLRVSPLGERHQPKALEHLGEAHARKKAGAEHHPDDDIRGHLPAADTDAFPLQERLLDPRRVDPITDGPGELVWERVEGRDQRGLERGWGGRGHAPHYRPQDLLNSLLHMEHAD